MGITNSAEEYSLNTSGKEDKENSGVSDYVITVTGNKERKKGLQVYNDTYTCAGGSENSVINAQLANWFTNIGKGADDISSVLSGLESSGRLISGQAYSISGHPDKWVVDYSQDYNNCGVNSSLNVLGIAGIKDIVEHTSTYQSYLSTGKETTKTSMKLLNGVWQEVTETVVTYPKAVAPTEDQFLLWAVQNSPNDELLHEETYPSYGIFHVDLTLPPDKTYLDYCFHSKNYDSYKTVDDLRENVKEIGGTNVFKIDNILEYWGLESSVHWYKTGANADDYDYIDKTFDSIRYMVKDPDSTVTWEEPNLTLEQLDEEMLEPFKDPITDESTIGGENKEIEITRTTDFDNTYTTKTTVTEIVETEKEEEETEGETEGSEGSGNTNNSSNSEEKEKEEDQTFTITEVEYTKNTDKYTFLSDFENHILEGKGVILTGYATRNYEGEPGSGGAHAITLVGVVRGEAITKTTEWAINGDIKDSSFEVENDIVGLYVIDTGGWLGNPEKAQFITPDQLYHFLANGRYEKAPGDDKAHMYWSNKEIDQVFVNVTNDNIRKWADTLNLVGNNRKNVLEGNESMNSIYGKKGNDVLYGHGGDDFLYGDQDQDTLYGGAGNNILTGGSGNDTYVFQTGTGITHDTIIAGSGKDYIQFDSEVDEFNMTPGEPCQGIEDIINMKYYNKDGDLYIEYDVTGTSAPSTITVKDYFDKSLFNSIKDIVKYEIKDNSVYSKERYDFFTNLIERGHISYIANKDINNTLKGTKYMDSIVAGDRNDVITGANGNDIINGGASNDTIKAGNGDDVIWGSYGNDKIYGDAGNDTIIYRATEKEENEKGFAGSAYGGCDTIYSGKGEDIIELKDYASTDLMFTKANKDLVITYDKTTGSSITIANYFGKKGNTSLKELHLKDAKLDLVKEYNAFRDILGNAIVGVSSGVTGTDAYDLLKGGAGNDSITGGLGHDTLYGGNGDDTLNGGLNSDKLYGQAGNNTYIFDNKALGHDTIYTSGNGKTTIDFTGSGVNFDSIGVSGNEEFNEYAFTKVKNDLIINYATSNAERDNAAITISNFFKSKGDFEIISDNGESTCIKSKAVIYMPGVKDKKNKLTGSNYNDSIIGGNFNDTIKGGNGNDILVGGYGNDNLTGGAGNNTILYKYGDGADIINLTKNEKLDIKLSDFDFSDPKTGITFDIVKNDLVISYINDKGIQETLLTLKNFGTKDVTTANGSVNLYNVDENGVETLIADLREDAYLDTYTAFTMKNYKYKGNWHAEIIDASDLNFEPVSKDRGANINAGAGDDSILGSYWNDTINGGDGDDVIYSLYGVNKVDGGNGSDEYNLFAKGTLGSENLTMIEETIVKDTGKDADAIDVAKLHCTVEDLQNGKLWFNVKTTDFDTSGNYIGKNITFNVADANGNKATLTGIEEIYVDGKKYDINQVASNVAAWLQGNGMTDVQTAIKNTPVEYLDELYATFVDSSNFVA